MTIENNTKYIAEAWINNGEDEEFKKSFLKSLIWQLQGHTNGFDADTVDGKHLSEIEEMISEAIKDFITSFEIGNTSISEGGIKYYLGFEAIKLYNIEGENVDVKYKTLPWSQNPYSEENPYSDNIIIPDLHDIIDKLYELTYLNIGEDGQIIPNYEIYKTFKNTIESDVSGIDTRLSNLEDILVGRITEDGYLDAQTVNGIRFFIYNNEEYDALVNSAAQYDATSDNNTEQSEQDYIKLNSINNVFIIRDKQELIDAGYENGTYTQNPDIAVINKYYEFQIDTKYVYNETTKTNEPEKWLQYKYQNETTWKDMCKASEFIDEDSLEKWLVKTISENSEYTLNSEVVQNALNDIPIDDESQIPFAIYNRQNFLKGGVYNFENENSYTELPVETIDNFQFLNLNPIETLIDSKVSQEHNNLQNYIDSNEGVLGGIKSNLQGITSSLSSLKGGSDKTINDLSESISKLSTSIDTLNSTINSIQRWTGPYYINSSTPGVTKLGIPFDNIYSQYWVNELLGLVVIYFGWHQYHGKGDTGWVDPKPVSNASYPYSVNYAHRPITQVIFSTFNSPNIFVKIEDNGRIYVRSNFSSTDWHNVRGHGIYSYRIRTTV